MAHIGIKRLATRYSQEHATHNENGHRRILRQDIQAIDGVDGVEDREIIKNMIESKRANGDEPNSGDGCEP